MTALMILRMAIKLKMVVVRCFNDIASMVVFLAFQAILLCFIELKKGI